VGSSLDWPMSREEKRRQALRLYERDVRDANRLIQAHERDVRHANRLIQAKEHEVQALRTDLRRMSIASAASSTRCPDSPRAKEKDDHSSQSEAPPVDASDNTAAEAPGAVSQSLGGSEAKQRVKVVCPLRQGAEARLHLNLSKFFEYFPEHSGMMDRAEMLEAARNYACECNLPPMLAVQWLNRSLDTMAPVQWPNEKVPKEARDALAQLSIRIAAAGAEAGSGPHCEILEESLDADRMDAARTIAFRGCPSPALRPRLWRKLLGVECSDLNGQRQEYFKLRSEMLAKSVESEEALQIRANVEAEAPLAWQGEQFTEAQDVVDAVTAVTLTYSVHNAQHVRGTCEVATVLLYAMSAGNSEPGQLAAAEADTYLCLQRMLKGSRSGLADDSSFARRAARVHTKLSSYDAQLGRVLKFHGLAAFPTTRLGVAWCTRAGFPLAETTRMWDSMLCDPCRFEFCDFIVIALMVLSRRELIIKNGDASAIAEAILASPRNIPVAITFRIAHTLCAFERQCGPGSKIPYPPPRVATNNDSSRLGGVLDIIQDIPGAAAEIVQTQASALWRKMRKSGAGALRASKDYIRSGAPAPGQLEGNASMRRGSAPPATHRTSSSRGGESASSGGGSNSRPNAASSRPRAAAPCAEVEEASSLWRESHNYGA